MFIETFYEPYLYDIELSIVSNDAVNVRSHADKQDYKKVDWT